MAEAKHYYPDTLQQIQLSSVQVNLAQEPVRTEDLAEELKEITSLYNVAVGVGSTLKLEEVIWRLYKESSRLIDTTNFAVVIYDGHTDTLNFALVINQGQQLKPLIVERSESQGLIANILTSQIPSLIPDLKRTDYNGVGQIRSWLGVPILNPLLTSEGPQGVIATWSFKPNKFTDRNLWLLSAIGTQAAIAIRNARMYEASQQQLAEMARLKDIAQRQVTEMALLNDITRTLSTTLHFDEVLFRIMERVEGVLKAEAGWLLLTAPKTYELVFQVGLGRTRTIAPFKLSRGEGLAGEVALTGKPVLVKFDSKKHNYEELKQGIDFEVNDIICVPLIQDDQVIGILEVMSKEGDEFTQHDLNLLTSIVPYAVIAIKNSRFHESVLSERDRVIEAEEQARKALARDLHDGATQLVSAMLMRLDFCKMLVDKDSEKLAQELEATQELARQAIHQIRTLLFELRPLTLEAQGLIAALEVFVERRQKDIIEGNTTISLKTKSINGDGDISRQDDKVEGTIFAIVQEAVNNAIKHARAQNIIVEVEETFTSIYTVISDDGDGFDVDEVLSTYDERGSLGMINIRERADLIGGDLKMKSAPHKGTKISIRVPKAKEERLKKRGMTGPLSLPSP
jgi:signal transduction histidine kinase